MLESICVDKVAVCVVGDVVAVEFFLAHDSWFWEWAVGLLAMLLANSEFKLV